MMCFVVGVVKVTFCNVVYCNVKVKRFNTI